MSSVLSSFALQVRSICTNISAANVLLRYWTLHNMRIMLFVLSALPGRQRPRTASQWTLISLFTLPA